MFESLNYKRIKIHVVGRTRLGTKAPLARQKEFLALPLWRKFIFPVEVYEDTPAEWKEGWMEDWPEWRSYLRLIKDPDDFDPERHTFQLGIPTGDPDDPKTDTTYLERTFINDREKFWNDEELRNWEKQKAYFTQINLGEPLLNCTRGLVSWFHPATNLEAKFSSLEGVIEIVRAMADTLDFHTVTCNYVIEDDSEAVRTAREFRRTLTRKMYTYPCFQKSKYEYGPFNLITYFSYKTIMKLPFNRLMQVLNMAYKYSEIPQGVIIQPLPLVEMSNLEHLKLLAEFDRVLFDDKDFKLWK